MGGLDKENAFDVRVKEPYNQAWESLRRIRVDDSDDAWNEFSLKLNEFDQRFSQARSPHEFNYLRHLYHVMLEAAEVIGEIHRQNGSKAVGVKGNNSTVAATK